MDAELIGLNLVDGKELPPGRGERIEHVNPATGKVQGWIAVAGADEVDHAVAAARAAARPWRDWPASRRRDVLLRLASLIQGDAEELTRLAVAENGTPVAFAGQVGSGSPAAWFRYYAGWADKLVGEVTPKYHPGADLFDYNYPEPYGVVAVLTAFNAPMSFVGMKVAPALAAGNTVVIKPSELAPFTTGRFAALCAEAGLPDGVVNVVQGGGPTGAALVGHPGLDKITFTGSAPTASRILAAAAPHLTPATLELGGKSASIVFEDADLAAAVRISILRGIATQAGQACLAPTRLLVARPVYDDAVELAARVADSLRVGDPASRGTQVGPVISQQHCGRILDVISRARESDGRLVGGGFRLDGDLRDGFFIKPAVFADVVVGSTLEQEEVFGPVLSVLPFDDEDEAIRIANGTRYGLAGYIFTDKVSRAHRVARRLDAGSVSVNTVAFPTPNVPFGGNARSGTGREGGYEGIREMVRPKNVEIDLSV
jgi:aldehyde dehydrogenase (NAD+)